MELLQKIKDSERAENFLDSEQYPFGANKYQWYELAVRLSNKKINRQEFINKWGYFCVNHEDKEIAKHELRELIWASVDVN